MDWIAHLPFIVVATLVGVLLLVRSLREVHDEAVPGYRWAAVRRLLRGGLRTPLGQSLCLLLLTLAAYLLTLWIHG